MLHKVRNLSCAINRKYHHDSEYCGIGLQEENDRCVEYWIGFINFKENP